MAAGRKARRPAPDPAIHAPSGETWASVRALYETGAMAKVSVARLAGIAARTLREKAQREGWAGQAAAARLRRSDPHPSLGQPATGPRKTRLQPGTGPRKTSLRLSGETGVAADAAPLAMAPVADQACSPAGASIAGMERRGGPPRGKGGRFAARTGDETVADLRPAEKTERHGGTAGGAGAAPDPRTASGRAALVDQLYGLFAAQLAAAGGEDGLGGGLEQRMRSLATFAKTLDALVDLDRRLGGGPETEGADFDAYRAELERCLASLAGGGG